MGSNKSEVSFFSIEGAINAKSVMSKSSTPKMRLVHWQAEQVWRRQIRQTKIQSIACAPRFGLWIHWSTVKASSISPVTLPYSPVDWPTPRKLKRTRACMFWSRQNDTWWSPPYSSSCLLAMGLGDKEWQHTLNRRGVWDSNARWVSLPKRVNFKLTAKGHLLIANGLIQNGQVSA